MKPTALIRCAAAAAAAVLVATACGTSETEPGTPAAESSGTSTTTATTSAAAAPSRERIAPRQESTQGPATTIADYIAENDISETPVFRGDPGAPTVDLPFPEGWQDAGADTPEWAYGAIYYSGPGAEEYTPSIVALLSRLTGDVDPDAIIEYAAGELTNLPGWEPLSRGRTSTLSGFPAYQLGGTWVQDGVTKVVAQKTAVIPGADGLYVLQLNADGLESQLDIIGPATDIIDDQTVITP
ncbi:LpqN/LpqT family lipoprotein [Mycolicibacterium poriferae]|uniref:LpqN/LpqT family lipoprotein n=1 Tax=Mycolicibacterium poriferae TaxID=39694 RepID=UPI0024BA84AC|nr:LpqN/LpqT family lipoprotein [Mycolicibacterium poriferae]